MIESIQSERERSDILAATASRVKVVYESETVDADELTFEAAQNTPMSYRLSDGAAVEIKHEVKKVFRLCDKKKADGSPIYLFTGEAQVRVIQPEKKPDLL